MTTKKIEQGMKTSVAEQAAHASSLAEIASRIEEFRRRTFLLCLAFALIAMAIGFIGWKTIWWQILIGFAMGFASLHVLIATIGNLDGETKRAFGKAFVFSFFKMAVLVLIVWVLYRLGIELIPVLAGLLLSQFAIVASALITLYFFPRKVAEKRCTN
jgi:hypothetical protein